jgi:hypothetical protein
VCSRKLETRYDNGQLKEKYALRKDSEGNYIKHGKYVSWYENGEKKQEGEFKTVRKMVYTSFGMITDKRILKENSKMVNESGYGFIGMRMDRSDMRGTLRMINELENGSAGTTTFCG